VNAIPAAEMGASGFPGRGLEYARPVVRDGEPAIEALCDCGQLTVLTLAGADIRALREPADFAYTCGGCSSSHWLTVCPVAEAS
jgi:hypothetical protein